MMTRGEFIGATALAVSGCAFGGLSGPRPRPLKRLGTIDIFVVETNPIVFKGRPLFAPAPKYTGALVRH